MTSGTYDLAVVGAGIVGLAHALAAARLGRRVIVIDQDARANGASVRNFGFVTVTGQAAGDTWRRARRSRDIWLEVAGPAGIPTAHRGTVLVARTPEGMAIFEEFAAGEMGAGCEVLTAEALADRLPVVRRAGILGGLWSPHELRIDPRSAIPALARYLEAEHGVAFARGTHVRAVEPPVVETTAGRISAAQAVVCPGNSFLPLFPETIAAHAPTLCKLHMLRLACPAPGWRLNAAVMTDLSCVRYLGFADCPSVPALRARLEETEAETLRNGIHLIVVQNADGSLVVGDSHHYGPVADPFAAASVVDDLILRHAKETLDLRGAPVMERWLGCYPSLPDRPVLVAAPRQDVRLVIVTSGTGMSTAFGIAEEVVSDLMAR